MKFIFALCVFNSAFASPGYYSSLFVFPSPLPPTTTFVGLPEEGPDLLPPEDSFRQENNTEVESQVGATAVLHCQVNDLGTDVVSWIRRRDYHLLTVGAQTYSSDERFQLRHIKQLNDWQLHVRFLQPRDTGVYECQISSHPPASLLTHLSVVEATSEILGPEERYVTVGSSLRLVCVMRSNTEPPSYVFWYHNDAMINYQNYVRVDTTKEMSVLFLRQVTQQHTGNYTCQPSNTLMSRVAVHVLKGGEIPAAIHSGENMSTALHFFTIIIITCFVMQWQISSR